MGSSLSEQREFLEKPLSPRCTAPPPPPLNTTTMEFATFLGTPSCEVRIGFGSSSASEAPSAAREALTTAVASLAATSQAGHSPTPALTVVACRQTIAEAEEVRCELVRAMPEAYLHGGSSLTSLLAGTGQSHDSNMDTVECLLLEAPEGSFAAAWDDTGDALYAAEWLQEQMPDARAIIMATELGQEESARIAIQSVFPGIEVYGSNAAEAPNWITLSHLGCAEHGISLVGIGVQVGFGAAHVAPRGDAGFPASFLEVYRAAMVAGNLERATAGLLTCRGCQPDSDFADNLRAQMAETPIPILGLACADQTHSLENEPSIGIMLFGDRHPPAKLDTRNLSNVTCSIEEEAASVSTAWPHSPATDASSTESTGPVEGCSSQSVHS